MRGISARPYKGEDKRAGIRCRLLCIDGTDLPAPEKPARGLASMLS
jgi:hypothetical protein